jgi:hypothetical protein
VLAATPAPDLVMLIFHKNIEPIWSFPKGMLMLEFVMYVLVAAAGV